MINWSVLIFIFAGNFDYAIGTNLFFESSEPTASRGPFKIALHSEVTPLLCETKILNLKPVQTAAQEIVLPNNDLKNVEFNFNIDYSTLIERLANGSLKLEEMTATKPSDEPRLVEPEPPEQLGEKTEEVQKKLETSAPILSESCEMAVDNCYETSSCAEELIEDYKRLKQLSMRPVKREVKQELVAECENKYKDAFEYHNIEKQVSKPKLCSFESFNATNVSQIDIIPEDSLTNVYVKSLILCKSS